MPFSMCLQLLIALSAAAMPARGAAGAMDADSAASAQIREELRAYYSDLQTRNWTSIVTHFYPAKVTARFAVPADDSAWAALRTPALEPAHADMRGFCAPAAAIAIVGHWARVFARRCTGEVDEAWFYSMSGRWKIIHLESGTTTTAS